MPAIKKIKPISRGYLQALTVMAVIMVVVVIGVVLLVSSHAQSTYVASYAANGQRAGTTSLVSGGSGSSGQAVQFGTLTNTLTPNKVFDLSDWNLTLPVDSTGGTGGTTCPGEAAAEVITTPQLLAGFSDPYFELNSSNDLVFTAPSNGATTTPCEGSNHVRSELHEFYTGPDAQTNDTWLSSLGGSLTATAVVDSVSVDADEATFGQIHGNGSSAFVLLIFRPAKQEVLLAVYPSPTAAAATETVIESNVTLGETIHYTLSFKDGLITATVNGTTLTQTAGSAWDTYPVRFALGAYSAAPNTGNPNGDQTQVTFSSFSISH